MTNTPDPMFTCDDTPDDKVKGLMQIIESQKQTHDALIKKLEAHEGRADALEKAVRDFAKESLIHLNLYKMYRGEIHANQTPMTIKHADIIKTVGDL